MTSTFRARARLSTIVGSSWVLLWALQLTACARELPPRSPNAASSHADSARDGADEEHPPAQVVGATTKAPAPHLRDPATGARVDHSDPVPNPAAASGVSLGGILAYADLHAPLLTVARSTRSRALAEQSAAEVLLPNNPQLAVAAGPRLSSAGPRAEVEVSLLQQIQIGGERAARLDAAQRFGELTEANIEQLRWTVHTDVHAAFHRCLVEGSRVALARRVVAFQKVVLSVVQRQIAAGDTSPLTLRLAQVEVAQADQQLVAAEQRLLASRIRLAQLSGWPAASPPRPAGQVEQPREPPPLAKLVAVARRKLPTLHTADARIAEARARLTAADRQGWPQPSIGVSYRHEGAPAPGVAINVVTGVLSVPIPVFQRNQGPRARAQADVSVAQAQRDAAHQLLRGQLAAARSEVVAAAQRARTYRSTIVPRFEENLTLLRRSFELGEIDILALSAGRERFLRIQQNGLAAQLDYFVALAQLERVVGVELWRDDHHSDEEQELP